MSRRWFKPKRIKCDCEADLTQVSTVFRVKRGNPPVWKSSRKVRHFREADGALFWHWEDQADFLVGNKLVVKW